MTFSPELTTNPDPCQQMKSRHRTFVGCARVSSPKMDEHFDYIITFNVICPFGCICLHSAAVHDMVNICLCDGVSEVIRGRRFHKTHGVERQAGRMGVNSTRVTTIPIQKDESDYPAARGSVGCPLRCPEIIIMNCEESSNAAICCVFTSFHEAKLQKRRSKRQLSSGMTNHQAAKRSVK